MKRETHILMRAATFALLYLARAAADCYDCCAPGGTCDYAYKQGPGVCCGGNQCCSHGMRCHACVDGAYRCVAPFETPPRCAHDDVSVLFSLGALAACVLCVCWMVRRAVEPPPTFQTHQTHQNRPVVYGTPHYAGGGGAAGAAVMGLVGGLLLGEVLEGDCDATPVTNGVQADV